MLENSNKQSPKGSRRTETASTIADIANVTPRYVRMVLNGERENEDILTAAIVYEEGKNELLEKVKQLVPFNA